MSTVRIDFREYPMHRPLPTNKLSRGVLLYAYQEGARLVWDHAHDNPKDPSLKADSVFLEQNTAPFQPAGSRTMSFHHAAETIANRQLLVQLPNKKQPFYILRAPGSDIPLWTTGIVDAYNRELDRLNQEAEPYRRRKRAIPKGLGAKLKDTTWRRDLFAAHSVPSNLSINENSPYWKPQAERVAFAFYKKVKFEPELEESDATNRNMLEALKRMHGPALIIAHGT